MSVMVSDAGNSGLLEDPFADESTCIMAGYYQFFLEVPIVMELGGVGQRP
jgi:hypothetical protein